MDVEGNKQLQEDEIIVLSSIYDSDVFYPNTNNEGDNSYTLKFPVLTNDDFSSNDIEDQNDIFLELNLVFPDTYPSEEPPIYTIKCTWIEKGIGEVIVYEWVQALTDYIETELKDNIIEDIKKNNASTTVIVSTNKEVNNTPPDSSDDSDMDEHLKSMHITSFSNASIPDDVEMPEIFSSKEPVIDRKSVFIAHLAPIQYITQVGMVVRELLKNKKIAKATHNMFAYRIEEEGGVINEGNDDDGEHGAGITLEGLLELVDARNVFVMVSRWHGGIKLGTDRNKHIKDIAFQLLDEHGYVHRKKKNQPSTKNTKKKSKK
ncbi:ribosomal protein S5 domain 2-like protein [Neocallimastix californiae]|uniref:Ribosomal protein S5 domain 2-like protein n=1 Tax=Neocallimastix californiae TaxID=1754190 RepID=A0A1Y2AK67_9FUNG|nr:ribosomal protein S5 domain 2-like protein [Neocallimastix californiae]|eukprot:ORY22882.1 ribosomal protein S5 domain 2-like protein [Neocallimastix californiae]